MVAANVVIRAEAQNVVPCEPRLCRHGIPTLVVAVAVLVLHRETRVHARACGTLREQRRPRGGGGFLEQREQGIKFRVGPTIRQDFREGNRHEDTHLLRTISVEQRLVGLHVGLRCHAGATLHEATNGSGEICHLSVPNARFACSGSTSASLSLPSCFSAYTCTSNPLISFCRECGVRSDSVVTSTP